MNRLLYHAATATNTGVGFPGLFRLDMSILRRLIGHGRALFRYHIQAYGNKNPVLGKLDSIIGRHVGTQSQTVVSKATSPGPLDWIGQEIHSRFRQIFVNNVLRRVTNSMSTDLRNKASQQLLHGNNSRPFFALVGVSLASGAGMLTKDAEFEGICWEIRESFIKKQEQMERAARNISLEPEPIEETEMSVKSLSFGPLIAQGSSAAVYSARWKENNVAEEVEPESYPLGVKMMFNFYCESNSAAIIRAMAKEIVPARNVSNLVAMQADTLGNLKRCPPHPNIIEISHVFTDQIPMLSESLERYPDALPRRLNEDGLGRNMSLFLVMKRYDSNLQTYVRNHPDLKLKQRILILTQLLEGIAHLNKNEIAHRDLKGDNILLDLSAEAEYPHLVITDFGCCLADKTHGLQLPFPSIETDRGGNAALMAPEVSAATPGSWKKISYEKSDAWSAGAIAYEIMGHQNPFISVSGQNLDPRTYAESSLPDIESVPPVVNALVRGLLKRKPNQRLSAELAATICHIYLWGPTRWLFIGSDRIPDSEIMQWLLTLTTKLLCQTPRDAVKLEFILIRSFLKRLTFTSVRTGLDWIQTSVK